MIRLILLALLLVYLAGLREPYREAKVPKHVTGTELQTHLPGLVEFKGHILRATVNHPGGRVLKVSTPDGQQVTVYIAPTIRVDVPEMGTYISVTGKMIGANVVTIEDGKGIRSLLLPMTELYEKSTGPGEVNQRVEFRVNKITPLTQRIKSGNSQYVVIDGKVTALIDVFYLERMLKDKPVLIRGYTLDSGFFLIEGWER